MHLFDPYIDVDMPINNYYSNEILIEIRERYALMISLLTAHPSITRATIPSFTPQIPPNWDSQSYDFIPGPSKCAPTLLLASHLQLKNV